MNNKLSAVKDRRQEIRDNAAKIGIDDDYISCLVDTFYGRIRTHVVLGPLFNERIGENWESHQATMKNFWASVAFNAGRYSGQPVLVHKKLSNVKESDFELWLDLFEATLVDTAKSPEAVDYLLSRAKRIAQSLKLAMFFKID